MGTLLHESRVAVFIPVDPVVNSRTDAANRAFGHFSVDERVSQPSLVSCLCLVVAVEWR